MRILFLSWYDRKNPAAGGAEKLGHEILKRLVEIIPKKSLIMMAASSKPKKKWLK